MSFDYRLFNELTKLPCCVSASEIKFRHNTGKMKSLLNQRACATRSSLAHATLPGADRRLLVDDGDHLDGLTLFAQGLDAVFSRLVMAIFAVVIERALALRLESLGIGKPELDDKRFGGEGFLFFHDMHLWLVNVVIILS